MNKISTIRKRAEKRKNGAKVKMSEQIRKQAMQNVSKSILVSAYGREQVFIDDSEYDPNDPDEMDDKDFIPDTIEPFSLNNIEDLLF